MGGEPKSNIYGFHRIRFAYFFGESYPRDDDELSLSENLRNDTITLSRAFFLSDGHVVDLFIHIF